MDNYDERDVINFLQDDNYDELDSIVSHGSSFIIERLVKTKFPEKLANKIDGFYHVCNEFSNGKIACEKYARGIELLRVFASKMENINHLFPFYSATTKRGSAQTILHIAEQCHSAALMEDLIELGADASIEDPIYEHILFRAQSLDMVEALIRSGVPHDTRNSKGETLLHSMSLRPETAIYLLDNGLNVNSLDRYGNTPLMKQAMFRLLIMDSETRLKVIDILIKRGGDLSIINHEGDDVMDLLCKNADCSMFFPTFFENYDYSSLDSNRMHQVASDYIAGENYKQLAMVVGKLKPVSSRWIELIEVIASTEECDYIDRDKFDLIGQILKLLPENGNAVRTVYDVILKGGNENLRRLANKSLQFKAVNKVSESDSSDFSRALDMVRDIVGRRKKKPQSATSLSQLLDIYVEMRGAKYFDIESVEGKGSYSGLVMELASLAHDWEGFDVSEEARDCEVKLELQREGWVRNVMLTVDDDYIDEHFFLFMKQVSSEVLEYDFVLLPPVDQGVGVVYMPEELAEIFYNSDVL